jgi:hypothetical protein
MPTIECSCSQYRGLCSLHQEISVPHVAPSAYGNVLENDGQQALAGLIGSAKASMERLKELVDIADRETNTQAKANALNEVVRAAQHCQQNYTTLALMKNCGFVDYNAKV